MSAVASTQSISQQVAVSVPAVVAESEIRVPPAAVQLTSSEVSVLPEHMPQTRELSPLPQRVEEPVHAVPPFAAVVVSV